MMTNTVRSAATLLCAAVLSAVFGAQPVLAQSCPYFTGKQLDRWFLETTQFGSGAERVLLCVDGPGFVTLDFLDRSAPRSLYLDVTFATSHTQATVKFDLSPAITGLSEVTGDISSKDADACRRQIVTSRAWSVLGCPNN